MVTSEAPVVVVTCIFCGKDVAKCRCCKSPPESKPPKDFVPI